MPGAGMVRLSVAEAQGPGDTPMDLDAVERELYGDAASSTWRDEHASVISTVTSPKSRLQLQPRVPPPCTNVPSSPPYHLCLC